MKIIFIDIPFGSIWQTDIAQFYENILSEHRKEIITKKLFEKFQIERPKHKTFTLGLLCLASTLEKNGYQVEYIINDEKSLVEKISDKDIVCYSIKTTTVSKCLNLAKQVKEKFPNVVNIFGGPHATTLYNDIISYSFVDIVVIGEGDETLLEIVKAIEHKNNLSDIKGLSYKENESIKITKNRELCDINNSVPINYSILPGSLDEYYLYFETRRGCNFGCSYCASHFLWRKKARTQSAEISYKNLLALSKKIKKNSIIHIVNSSFGFDSEDIKLCKLLIDNPINLFFSCDICASQITEERIKLMYDAGVKMFSIGMESASDVVLKKNHRPQFKYIENALLLIKKTCDAFIKGYWIVGLPGETIQSSNYSNNKLIELLKNNLLDIACEHIFVPYPGSNVFSNPENYNFKIYHKNWDFYDSRSFPLPAESNNFSMGDAYLAYINIIKSQCELYGISPNIYEKPISKNFVDFLEHKKHLT